MLATFLDTLKAFGPFTTPLCAAMGVTIWYLAGQVRDAQKRKDDLLEQIGEIREAGMRDYAEYGESMRNTLREFNSRAGAYEMMRTAMLNFSERADAVLQRVN